MKSSTGYRTVRPSMVTKTVRVAKYLPKITSQSEIGKVKSSSAVPVLRSSDNSLIVSRGRMSRRMPAILPNKGCTTPAVRLSFPAVNGFCIAWIASKLK